MDLIAGWTGSMTKEMNEMEVTVKDAAYGQGATFYSLEIDGKPASFFATADGTERLHDHQGRTLDTMMPGTDGDPVVEAVVQALNYFEMGVGS